MKVTGRLQNSTGTTTAREAFLATQSGEDIARVARVRKLRELVAAGRYRTEPDQLAHEILRRALRRSRRA